MKGELEFLQGAFEAYKGTLVQDMEEKWNKKEVDMKLKFQEDMENALQEQSKCGWIMTLVNGKKIDTFWLFGCVLFSPEYAINVV